MTNTNLCPLCQQPNECSLAAGKNASDCWCMQAKIAPEILAQIDPAQVNTSCICPKCASYTKSPQAKATDA